MAEEIFELLPDGEISLEVPSTTADAMIREGRQLVQWQPKALVKVPMTLEVRATNSAQCLVGQLSGVEGD